MHCKKTLTPLKLTGLVSPSGWYRSHKVRPSLELRDIPNGGMKLFGSSTPESGHHKFCTIRLEKGNWKFENPWPTQSEIKPASEIMQQATIKQLHFALLIADCWDSI
jgi:hypothetical protein